MSQLKVAAVQTSPRFGEIEHNVNTALAVLPDECNLVVLPELFATGYQFRSHDEARDLAEEIPTGPVCRGRRARNAVRDRNF